MPRTNAENQQSYTARMKAAGYRRLVLWVPADDLEDLKLMARSKHAIAQVKRSILKTLRKTLHKEQADRLRRQSVKAILKQIRANARRQVSHANAPPLAIQFHEKPPRALRQTLHASQWLYDPVTATWHLPRLYNAFRTTAHPDQYFRNLDLLEKIAAAGIPFKRLDQPPDDVFTRLLNYELDAIVSILEHRHAARTAQHDVDAADGKT